MAGVKLVGEDEPHVEDRMDVESALVANARSATNT